MSKKEMIKTNLRGLKLVYSSLSIPKIFVILFIVFDVMYNYWGLFFASHLIDDLVLRVERERILGDFLGLTVGNGICNVCGDKILFLWWFHDMGGCKS